LAAKNAKNIWTKHEVEIYEKPQRKTRELQKKIPEYVKEIIRIHVS
jgi:hypothetical protein